MKQSTHLWLIRHGHIVQPVQKSFIGQIDVPLSMRGRQQIQGWKNFFSQCSLAAVLCSDLSRCQDSAALLCPPKTPIIAHTAFREIHLGAWDGQSIANIRTQFPQEYALRGAHFDTFRPPQGESFQDLADRVLPALKQQLQLYAGKNIALVAHAGVNRVVLADYLSIPLAHVRSIPQYYACVTHVEYM